MAGTLNIWDRLEFSGPTGSIAVGNLSLPYTITLTSGVHWRKTYSITDNKTYKIFDEFTDLDAPAFVRVQWTDGPIEFSWGDDDSIVGYDNDTSSFVTNDSEGGFMYFWGSGMYEHDSLVASTRNGVDGGSSADVGIQAIYVSQTSGKSITIQVDAFK